MTEQCREYAARIAARKAVMKGLDPSAAGAALAAAGLTLCYPNVDFAKALEIWRHLNAYCHELLMLEAIGKAQAAGVSLEELAALCALKQKKTEEFLASGGPALMMGRGA